MKRFLRTALFLGVAALSLKGCIFSPEKKPPVDTGGVYASLTAPESLLHNLQVSYDRRDIEEYSKILAPDFIFIFQPADAALPEIDDFWTRTQDTTGTRALFRASEVSDIRISLVHQPRDTTYNTPGTPLDTLRLFVSSVDLQVDQVDGITFVVADQQDMFFRQGIADADEDTTRWFLYEWRDLPTLGAPGPAPLSAATADPQRVSTSWGALRQEALEEASRK